MIRKIFIVASILALPLLQGCGLSMAGLECDSADCKKNPAESNTNAYVCSCSCDTGSHDSQLQVISSADDAEQTASSGVVQLIGGTLEIPANNLGPQIVGVRFQNLGIPPGSTIVSANVQFTAFADEATPVDVKVSAEASDNAAAFSNAAHDLSARPTTNNIAPWSPAAWTANANGPDERTPNLQPVLQEIVDRPGWAQGNAVVLLFTKSSGNGVRSAFSWEGRPLSAPVLLVTYNDPNPAHIGPQDLSVCIPPDFNVNLGHKAATITDLANDCANRVGDTFSGLAAACNYPSKCQCSLQPNTQTYSAVCDKPCVENPVAPDCSNFDPVNNVVKATNVPGDAPVCLGNCPLTFGMYGRRSECNVEGSARVAVEGETATPAAAGVVNFRGAPCPGGECEVGMEYRLDVDPVTFRTLFHSETFEELTGLGESIPGHDARVSPTGDGTFEPGQILLSARGQRGDDQQALETRNTESIHFNANFGSRAPTCSLHGSVAGSGDSEISRCQGSNQICRGDSECPASSLCPGGICKCNPVESSTFQLGLDLNGTIVNQPPTANAGKDQTVQCPAQPVLDASASYDLDGNIALFSWLRGGRAGQEVGSEAVSKVAQGPGTETYILRVIDARGQTDEDSTQVTVVDTTAPRVRCSVSVPVLTQPGHNMVAVGLSRNAHDACEGDLPSSVSVFANEKDEASSPDALGIATGSLRLRQERDANGDGRVYLIRVDATDSAGNSGVDCCTVVVPRSSNPLALRSIQEQANEARSYCLAHQGMPPAGYFEVGDGPASGPKR